MIATDEYAERQRQLAQYHAQTGDTLELLPPAELNWLKAPKRVLDEYSLQLIAHNVSDLTISDFLLSLEWELPPEVDLSSDNHTIPL